MWDDLIQENKKTNSYYLYFQRYSSSFPENCFGKIKIANTSICLGIAVLIKNDVAVTSVKILENIPKKIREKILQVKSQPKQNVQNQYEIHDVKCFEQVRKNKIHKELELSGQEVQNCGIALIRLKEPINLQKYLKISFTQNEIASQRMNFNFKNEIGSPIITKKIQLVGFKYGFDSFNNQIQFFFKKQHKQVLQKWDQQMTLVEFTQGEKQLNQLDLYRINQFIRYLMLYEQEEIAKLIGSYRKVKNSNRKNWGAFCQDEKINQFDLQQQRQLDQPQLQAEKYLSLNGEEKFEQRMMRSLLLKIESLKRQNQRLLSHKQTQSSSFGFDPFLLFPVQPQIPSIEQNYFEYNKRRRKYKDINSRPINYVSQYFTKRLLNSSQSTANSKQKDKL